MKAALKGPQNFEVIISVMMRIQTEQGKKVKQSQASSAFFFRSQKDQPGQHL